MIADLDSVDLVTPSSTRLSAASLKLRNKVSHNIPWFRVIRPGLNTPPVSRDYDLFFTSVALVRDLHALDALKGWRQRSRYAVCWIQELWNNEIEKYGYVFDILKDFDHVICSTYHTASYLQKRISVPVSYIPWGIDALGFCPWPNPPARVIDFYNIGGLSPVSHQALLEHAQNGQTFYAFDTEKGKRLARVPAEHRWRYGDMLRRSRYFYTPIAKVGRTQDRGSQEEFGLRFLEGAAGGAVLLGDRLDNPAFEEHLGWKDSVIQIPFECPEIVDFIAELDSQPERLAAISRRNVLQSLKRHDHLYRWEQILQLANLPLTKAMTKRRTALTRLIDFLESADTFPEQTERIGSV